MPMSMHPYYTIIGSEITDEDRGFQYFRMEGDSNHYVAVEHYCTNPECSCEDVLLEINQVAPTGKAEAIGSVLLNVFTWNIGEIEITGPGLNKSKFERELQDGIPAEWKSYIQAHRAQVQKVIRQDATRGHDFLTAEMIRSNATVGYVELFGDWEPGQDPFSFKYGERDIVVDDQYCANPSCDCQNGILTFVDITIPIAPVMKFSIRYATKKNRFEIIENLTSKQELDELVAAFESAKPEARKIVAQHYNAVKSVGKRVMQEERRQNEALKRSAAPAINVGRNDPCPCGSGKKYKKCCG